MEKKNSSKKNLIISIVVIAVVLGIGYWYFNGSSSSEAPVLSSSTASSSDTLLSTLDQLESLSLNSSIFTTPAFESLNDNTVTLPTVDSGRPNPFAPLPGLTPATSKSQTSAPTSGN